MTGVSLDALLNAGTHTLELLVQVCLYLTSLLLTVLTDLIGKKVQSMPVTKTRHWQ